MRSYDLYTKRWRSILLHDSSCHWTFCWSQRKSLPTLIMQRMLTVSKAPNLLGDYGSTSASYQACCPDRLCQLCILCVPLVHALLLPPKPGAILSDWWWRDYCGLWSRRRFRVDY